MKESTDFFHCAASDGKQMLVWSWSFSARCWYGTIKEQADERQLLACDANSHEMKVVESYFTDVCKFTDMFCFSIQKCYLQYIQYF